MEDYAIYLRKSRADLEAEQRGEGETLAKHRTALRALAERRGLHVVREYAELVTGDSIAARPQMQELLDDVKKGLYAGVIVNDIDRLGRGDSIDQEIIKLTFAAAQCLIITPTRDVNPASPTDEDMLDFSLFFSRFEYRKISQRLMMGKIRSVEAGNYLGSRIPFGYKIKKDGKSLKLEIDPEKAPIVKMIYEWYASGEIGYNAIAKRLNEMGIKTTRGYNFYPHGVSVILTNPVYIGTTIWARTKTVAVIKDGKKVKRSVSNQDAIVIEGTHEPIIDKEVFDKVQQMFGVRQRAARVNKNKVLKNPFAGLVVCSECGHYLQAQNSRRGCSLQCVTFGCQTVGTSLAPFENFALDALRAWCADYKEPSKEAEEDTTSQEKVLRKQLDTLKARLSKARELVELGAYTPQEYKEQRNLLQGEIDKIEEELNTLMRSSTQESFRLVIPEIEKVLDAYPLAENAAEKNKLLKSVIAKIVYTKSTRIYGKPDALNGLKIRIFPKLRT